MNHNASASLQSIAWVGDLADGVVRLLDQTQLPHTITYLEIRDLESLRAAILALAVRGAPAIGIAAAYGVAQHAAQVATALPATSDAFALEEALAHADERLRSSRPTAVNLMWALDRMRDCLERHVGMLTAREIAARLLMEARRIHREDAQLCDRIAANGAALLPRAGGIYTHCNTGCLATGGVGTAIGCIRQAVTDGGNLTVYAGETRPLLQGARLTAWELQQAGVEVRLCCDSMAGHLMARGLIDAVIVGADRITAQGDTANKIGTYQLAVLAKYHSIPFYVAAPYSTFDLTIRDGSEITIEERDPEEVRTPRGAAFAPADVPVVNPAFDVTPGTLITAILTERGVVQPVDEHTVRGLMDDVGSNEPAV